MSTFLPISVQHAIQPSQPAMPAPQMPMATNPDPGDAPDIGANAPGLGALLAGQEQPIPPAGGTFAQKLAHAAERIGIKPGEPGSWAKSLVGAAVDTLKGNTTAADVAGAVRGVGASLGDAAAVGTVPAGGGALTGITRTLAARNQRLAAQDQQQFENQQTKARNDALLAESHQRIIQTNQAIQQKSDELRKASLKDSTDYVNGFQSAGYHVENGITQQQLQQRIQADPKFWDSHSGGKTAEVPVLDANGQPKKDADGNVIYTPTYSVVDLRTAPPDGGKVTVTPAMRSYYQRNLGIDLPEGTQLTPEQFANQNAKAHQVADGFRVIEQDNGESLAAGVRDQLQGYLTDPDVLSGLNKYSGRPLKGIAEARTNADDHVAQIQQQIATLAQRNPRDPQIPGLQDQLKKVQAADQALNFVQANGFNDKARQDELAAQREDEKEKHDRAEETLQNRRADIQAAKETQQKGLGDSYKTENKEFDTIRKPLLTQLDAFSTLRSSLDQGTAAGDSVVAPALLKALVAGGGVRITQAEISNFTHGRSTVEDMKGYLQKLSNGKSITPEQRKQVYALLGAVESKVQQKNQILQDGQDALDNAATVAEQRQAVQDTRKKLSAIDAGQTANQAPKLPQAPVGMVSVQIPGSKPGFISQAALAKFKQDHPNAVVGE